MPFSFNGQITRGHGWPIMSTFISLAFPNPPSVTFHSGAVHCHQHIYINDTSRMYTWRYTELSAFTITFQTEKFPCLTINKTTDCFAILLVLLSLLFGAVCRLCKITRQRTSCRDGAMGFDGCDGFSWRGWDCYAKGTHQGQQCAQRLHHLTTPLVAV